MSEGVLGTGVCFNTSYQYVSFENIKTECPLDPGLCTAGYTISVWLKMSNMNPTGNPNILLLGYQNFVVGVRWKWKSDGRLTITSIAKGSSVQSKVTVSSPRGSWFHITTAFNSTLNPTIFINGVIDDDANAWMEDIGDIPGLLTTGINIGFLDQPSGDICMDELYIFQHNLEPADALKVFLEV